MASDDDKLLTGHPDGEGKDCRTQANKCADPDKPWLWKPGQSGNPKGRPIGSADRVNAIMNACAKLGREVLADGGKTIDCTAQEAVEAFLATLDKRTVAMLYSKTIPREQQVEFTGQTYEDMLQGMRDKATARKLAEQESTDP